MRRIKMTPTKTNNKPLIILTAGGTGGHIYPAESLAAELIHRGYRVALITDTRGKNNYKGKLGEIPNYAVLAGALVGKSKLFKLQSLIKTSLGIIQAAYIILKTKPSCIVGFGGYASFPASMAAILMGVDLIIHEQNSVMSRTNRFLSKYASLIAQSFNKVKYTPPLVKTVLTGMPIRQAIADIRNKPYPPFSDKFQIIILGGSQGAKIFGDILPQVINSLPIDKQQRLKIYQQCRESDIEGIKSAYKNSPADITISHFCNNMPELYEHSHRIISRAGASSVCEITAVGIPSILVPLPIAADNHQTFNAQEVKENHAGIVINQSDFTPPQIQHLLISLMDNYNNLEL